MAEYQRLDEICYINMGQSPDSKSYNEDGSGLPFFQGNADFGIMYPTAKVWCCKPIKVVDPDTLLISVRAPIGALNFSQERSCIGRGLAGITAKNGVNLKYVYYCLRSKSSELNSKGTGSTFKAITKNALGEIAVRIRNESEQLRIVRILDGVSDLITSHKQQVNKLDDLIKARFVEMFGDPIKNDKQWVKKSIVEVCKEIYGGGTPSKSHPEYYENGNIPWVSSKDMKKDIIVNSDIYINRRGIENSTAKIVPVDSVIMVIRSGILKHTLPVAINAVEITVNQDLKVFIPKKEIISRFLCILFKMMEKDILSGVRAVTADNIDFNSFINKQIIVPPIENQEHFVAFVHQVDKSRFAEMLGDISTGEYKYIIKKLGDVAKVGSSHRVFTTDFG